MVAGTRAVVEAGWLDARRQIGLSGRTVKPKLIITCGVSGAIQFVAGMSGSECIVAINNDPDASIFKVAHVALVGDLYVIVPELIAKLESGSGKEG
jgi:electron transfer flavoprotein alpha subunit